MNAREKFDELLADEQFQDDICKYRNSSKEKKKAVLQKYSITKKEFIYASSLFQGLTLKKEALESNDVVYATDKLKRSIKDSSYTAVPEKARRIRFISVMSRVAAVLAIPLLFSTVYLYQKTQNIKSSYYPSSKELVQNTILAPLGAKTQVVLPDGSIVWLNSGSSLSYPNAFIGDSRNVELKGEAFFEVVKNKKVPMLVSTEGMKVKVYGTKFNLDAFEGEETIKTALVEGKVSLIIGENTKEYNLKPGYAAFFNSNSKKLVLKEVEDMDEFIGWKDGKLFFRNERLVDIFQKMEKWYNVDIRLLDKSLEDSKIYATFYDENIEQVLDILSNSIPIQVEYIKRTKQPDGSYSKREIIVKRDLNKKMLKN